MNSDHIKTAVSKVNYILSTQDKNFTSNESKAAGTSLFLDLVVNFKNAPTTAIALVQHLVDHNFDITRLKGDAYNSFSKTFGPRLNELSAKQLSQLKSISCKLLN